MGTNPAAGDAYTINNVPQKVGSPWQLPAWVTAGNMPGITVTLGVASASGRIIEDGDLIFFDGTVWQNAGQIVGPQGLPGPQGNTGSQGPDGIRGPQGIVGPVPVLGPTTSQTLAPGNPVDVTLAGTGDKGKPLRFHFSIPRGADGHNPAITTGVLPAAGAPAGDMHIEADGSIWVSDGTQWNAGPNITGPQGIQGIQGQVGDSVWAVFGDGTNGTAGHMYTATAPTAAPALDATMTNGPIRVT